jgi:hypothetical protein
VKISRLIALAVVVLLCACLPKKPEPPLTEIPAGPAVEALALRRQSFATLKALAVVESVRSGRKRSYENVGIIVDGQRRLRAEAYGPLGQAVFTLVWGGSGISLRQDDDSTSMPAAAGLEKLFGVEIEASELCAVLTANLPASASSAAPRAYQEPDGSVLLEWTDGAMLRRFFVVLPAGTGPGQEVRIVASELYRSGKLVYRAWYEQTTAVSRYLMPKTVKIENPGKKISLTILYSDLEVNLPISDDAFILPGGRPGAP